MLLHKILNLMWRDIICKVWTREPHHRWGAIKAAPINYSLNIFVFLFCFGTTAWISVVFVKYYEIFHFFSFICFLAFGKCAKLSKNIRERKKYLYTMHKWRCKCANFSILSTNCECKNCVYPILIFIFIICAPGYTQRDDRIV